MSKIFLIKCMSLVFSGPIFFTACSKDKDSSEARQTETKLGTVEFVFLIPETLVGNAEGISGSGKIAAKLPLGEIKGKKNISLKTTIQEQGSVTLFAFGAQDLSKALFIEIKRTAGKLVVNLKKDSVAVDISKSFAAVDASKEIHLLFDFHNDEEPGHVLAWSGETTEPKEDNALFNSEKDGETPGNGEGTFWGAQISNAKVTFLENSAPKFSE